MILTTHSRKLAADSGDMPGELMPGLKRAGPQSRDKPPSAERCWNLGRAMLCARRPSLLGPGLSLFAVPMVLIGPDASGKR